MPAHEVNLTLPDSRTVPITYKVFGFSTPDIPIGAVFANGLGCAPETTESPAEALAEKGFKTVTFEPDPTARLTVRDRVHIMGELGRNVLGDYVAMGFGLGGDVATRVAYDDYEARAFEVAGLVDVAGSHEGGPSFIASMITQLPEHVFADPTNIGLPLYLDVLATSQDQGVRDYGAHIAKLSPPELAALHFGAVDLQGEAEVGGSLDQLLLYHGGPAYFVHGAGDKPPYVEDIKWQENIQLREIAGAGHFLHTGSPAAYVGALTECLIEVNGR